MDDDVTEGPFSAGEILDLFPRLRWSLEDGLDPSVPLDRVMPRVAPTRVCDAELFRASDAWHAARRPR